VETLSLFLSSPLYSLSSSHPLSFLSLPLLLTLLFFPPLPPHILSSVTSVSLSESIALRPRLPSPKLSLSLSLSLPPPHPLPLPSYLVDKSSFVFPFGRPSSPLMTSGTSAEPPPPFGSTGPRKKTSTDKTRREREILLLIRARWTSFLACSV